CSWQGLVTLPDLPDKHIARIVVGEHGSVGLWPAGGSSLQWWFDVPWSADFVRPERPIEMIRSTFTGWMDSIDRLLETLTDDDLARSPFPHFRHPITRTPGQGALTLLGDAAHTMPPTLAQGTNQVLLDTMVLCKALSELDAFAYGTIANVTRTLGETQRLRDLKLLRSVRDRMDREYAQPLDVEALARGVNMSAGHLSRQFKLAYGESPYSYLMTRRIERAMAMLRGGDLSVTEVCFAVGCSSLGTFSTRFTELVGMSPSLYREQTSGATHAMPSCVEKQVTRPIRNREAPAARLHLA
ncbi:MAG: hypothetical protein QOJ24_2688, partial [Mycobacterium sp.]|nr:hypothetical protein [Mycobacterium sp.]